MPQRDLLQKQSIDTGKIFTQIIFSGINSSTNFNKKTQFQGSTAHFNNIQGSSFSFMMTKFSKIVYCQDIMQI